jgi:hypothetical protein
VAAMNAAARGEMLADPEATVAAALASEASDDYEASAFASAALATTAAPGGWGTYRLRLKSAAGIEIWVRRGGALRLALAPCLAQRAAPGAQAWVQGCGAYPLLGPQDPGACCGTRCPARRPGTWWAKTSSSAQPGL